MRKILSALLPLALLAASLAGCAPDDAELYSAIKRTGEAENSVSTTTLTFALDVAEPVAVYGDNVYVESYVRSVNGDLDSLANGLVPEVRVSRAKSGESSKTDITLAYPDAEADFTFYGQGDRRIVKTPTVLLPFSSEGIRGVKYLYADKGLLERMATGSQDALISELGGSLCDAVAGKISYPLVTESLARGRETLYTVRLDAAALRGLSSDIMGIASEPEVIGLLALALYTNSKDAGTIDDVKAAVADGIAGAKADVDELMDAIADSGALKDGLTLRFAVANGLVTRRELTLKLDFDLSKPAVSGLILGEENASGRFTVTVNAVTDVAYGAASVELPSLTAENSVDLDAEYEEYKKYLAAKSEFDKTALHTYADADEYLALNPNGGPVRLINRASGAEVVTTPIIVGDGYDGESLMVSVKDFAAVIGSSVSWDPSAMAAEFPVTMRERQYTACVLNADGKAIFDEYWDNFDDEAGRYVGSALTPEQTAAMGRADKKIIFNGYFTEDGTAYIDMTHVYFLLGYAQRAGVGTLTIDTVQNAEFEYEGIEDNFFYSREDALPNIGIIGGADGPTAIFSTQSDM